MVYKAKTSGIWIATWGCRDTGMSPTIVISLRRGGVVAAHCYEIESCVFDFYRLYVATCDMGTSRHGGVARKA